MSWAEIALSELVEFSPKISLEKGELYDHIPMEAIDSGIKYPRETYQKEYTGGGTKFANGDTLFARITPCLENGKIAKVKDLEKQVGFGSTEYFVLRAKENISDSDFVYYLAKTDLVRQTAIKSMSGADGRQRADKGAVEQLMVLNIPLPTQRKIASILSAYDDLIENNLKRIKLLEAKAFVSYKLLDKVEKSNLTELYDTSSGGTPSRTNAEYFTGEINWFKSKELADSILLESEEKITEQAVDKSSAKLFPTGSVIIAMYGATIGKLGLLSQPSTTNQACCAIIQKDEIKSNYYILNWLIENKEYVLSFRMGAAQENISQQVIRNLLVSIPKDNDLKFFNQEMKPIYQLIKNLIQQNTKLREARDILLPKLMNGQIEV
jgi:type I restriction enzyme S subunit